jgi:hypothetical protein
VRVATAMAGAQTTRVERMGKEKPILLASTRQEAVEELTLLWIRGSELCLTIVSTPARGACMRECGLQLAATPRWLCGLPHSRRWCLRPCSLSLGACPLKSSRWMLWGRCLPSSKST